MSGAEPGAARSDEIDQNDGPDAVDGDTAPVQARAMRRARPLAQSSSRNPAPPVPEPGIEELPAELLAQMFKSPLDRRRAVPEAPPTPHAGNQGTDQSGTLGNVAPSITGAAAAFSAPQAGVSRTLPPVQPERFGRTRARPVRSALGPAPAADVVIPTAQRDSLPSTARQNRRFSRLTLGAFGIVIVGAVLGLSWIGSVFFG